MRTRLALAFIAMIVTAAQPAHGGSLMKPPKLLSVSGSTRATGYTLSNKIVTHQGSNFERPTGRHPVDIPWLIFRTGDDGGTVSARAFSTKSPRFDCATEIAGRRLGHGHLPLGGVSWTSS